MRAAERIQTLIGPRARPRISRSLRTVSPLSTIIDRWNAEQLAGTSKRLDLCAAEFAHLLHTSGAQSLHNLVCAEIGAGYVLSHSVVMHLLGARRVIAVDVQRIAHPASLSRAIGQSVAGIVINILSPFENRDAIRSRLHRLQDLKRFDFDVLSRFGIEYVAPLDLARDHIGTALDFVYTNAVLEHVPREELPSVLGHVAQDLTPGGRMISMVHLEDHRNLATAPFEFLQESVHSYNREMQTERGNRVRPSEWRRLFQGVPGTDVSVFMQSSRYDRPLPPRIDESIFYTDEEDLRGSHLGILLTKKT